MTELRQKIAGNVSKALDLVVTKAGAFKLSIEDLQCRAINARLDAMDPGTAEGVDAMFAGLLATQHIVQKLDNLVGDLDALIEEIQDLIITTVPAISGSRSH